MITDDLDYFLLQIASEGGPWLSMFDFPDLGERVNLHVPEHTRPELVAALVELFDRGDIEAHAEVPNQRRRRYQGLRLNADEIEAGIAGAIRIGYFLTPQGGERWARHARIDWQRWDGDQWSTSHNGTITTASREFTEFLFERALRSGEARGPGRWSEVRPWKAAYWHEEPVGCRVRYRLNQEFECNPHRYLWLDFLPRPERRPRDLVARRQRAIPVKARAAQEKAAAPLARLAAARERALRAGSVKDLIDQLKTRCPIGRYCAARALGKRKAVEAVAALLGVVFNEHDVAAVEALGQIGDPRVLEPLLVLFEHWRGRSSYLDPQFFVALQRTIVGCGEASIARIEELHAEGRIGLERAWYTLALSRSPRAVQFLARYMREHPYPVMDMLAEMGDDGRALLFAVATGEHETVCTRRSAAHRLAETTGVFREEAGRILASMPPRGEADVSGRVSAAQKALRHADSECRRTAVELLAALEARHLASEVARLATDESWMVRASVARALTRWGGPEDVLAALRKDPNVIVRGCTRWFEDALELRE